MTSTQEVRNNALKLYIMRSYKLAICEFNKVINETQEGTPADIWVRGRCYDKIGRYDNAVADYTRYIELAPNSSCRAVCCGELGAVYRKMLKYEDAIIVYTKGIQNKQSGDLYAYRGFCYKTLRQYELAILDCTMALEWYIGIDVCFHKRVYNTRVQCYMALCLFDLAKKDLSELISIGHIDLEVYAVRAVVNCKLGKYEESLRDHARALELSPGNIQFILSRIDTLHKMKKYELVASEYMKIHSLSSPDDKIWGRYLIEAAYAYAMSGQIEKALQTISIVTEGKPITSLFYAYAKQVHMLRGWAYFLAMNYDLAIEEFSKIRRIKTRVEFIRRAVLCIAREEYIDAQRDLEKAQRIEGDKTACDECTMNWAQACLEIQKGNMGLCHKFIGASYTFNKHFKYLGSVVRVCPIIRHMFKVAIPKLQDSAAVRALTELIVV